MIVQIKLKDSMMVITKVNEILFCEDKNSELVIVHNGNDKIKIANSYISNNQKLQKNIIKA
jgi:hypothetical protein